MSMRGTIAIFASLSALSLAAVLAGACAINPQPLPPETNDGSIGVDGGALGNFSGEDGAAAAPTSNGDADGGATGGGSKDSGDGGDGGDASTDASSDAGITDAGDAGG